MSDDKDSCVIRLDPSRTKPDPDRLVSKHRKRPCIHRNFIVDTVTRTVECGKCGAVIDPIEALDTLANDWETEWILLRRAKDEADRLLAEAKRERANAKSARRRAEQRAGKCEE